MILVTIEATPLELPSTLDPRPQKNKWNYVRTTDTVTATATTTIPTSTTTTTTAAAAAAAAAAIAAAIAPATTANNNINHIATTTTTSTATTLLLPHHPATPTTFPTTATGGVVVVVVVMTTTTTTTITRTTTSIITTTTTATTATTATTTTTTTTMEAHFLLTGNFGGFFVDSVRCDFCFCLVVTFSCPGYQNPCLPITFCRHQTANAVKYSICSYLGVSNLALDEARGSSATHPSQSCSPQQPTETFAFDKQSCI